MPPRRPAPPPAAPPPAVPLPTVPPPTVPPSTVPSPAVPPTVPPRAAASPVVELADDRAARRGVRLFLKRDDLIHPELPGNKWRKLRHNIAPAREKGTLLTFGGAYSNHIRAVAAAGRIFGSATIGVIRSEEHLPLNPPLTCGCAYSTPSRAGAAAGRICGLPPSGVIRGDEHLPLNPSLARAERMGMRLTYMDRASYRRKHEPEVIAALRERWGDFYLLP